MIHLFEQCHGELLVGNAVLGGTYVLFSLISNVEVDSHEEIFLQGENKSNST